MPYATIADLPPTFGTLPAEAKRVALAVVNDMLDAGDSDTVAIRKAWGAVKRSWQQDGGGEWVKKMANLETVDLLGVEVFATGLWNGDKYTTKDLDEMVEASTALPVDRPVFIGHDHKVTHDGQPAVGWVENLRREGEKLIGDVMRIPAKLKDLIDVGAFRKRSAEIYWNFRDQDGNVWPRVFRGVALLGADMPAVTSLEDILSLYVAEGELHVYEVTDGEPVVPVALDFSQMTDTGTYEWIQRLVREAIPPKPDTYYWVRATWPTQAIISECADGVEPSKLWLVPYTLAGDTVSLGAWQEITEQTVWTYAEEEGDDDLLAQVDRFLDLMEPQIRGRKGAPRARMWVAEARKRLEEVLGAKKLQQAEEPAESEQGEEVMKKVYALVGLPEDTLAEDAEPQVQAFIEGLQATNAAKDTELADLRPLREANFKLEMDAALDGGMADEKITPATRPSMERIYRLDPAGFPALLESMPKLISYHEEGSGGGSGEEGEDTDNSRLLAKVNAYAAKHELDLADPKNYRQALAAVKKGEV